MRRCHGFGGPVLVGLLAGLVLLGGCRFETGSEENVEESIETMLLRSAAAWNAGDLDGFVRAYHDVATTSFMTADGPVYGRSEIRALYAPRFEPGAARPTLRFEDLEVRPLPPLIGIVTGRYVLEDAAGGAETGWFTLVVRRVSDGWRIVHDHSS